MSNLATAPSNSEKAEAIFLTGDLSKLSEGERTKYILRVCESQGLNPLTRPIEYLTLQGKMILYARKDCTDQLRKIHNVSVVIVSREITQIFEHTFYVVTARATLPNGRTDERIGVVPLSKSMSQNDIANALMKAETKAGRRVTLSICGMGVLDESEVETIQDAKKREPQAVEKDESVAVEGFMNAIQQVTTPEELALVAEGIRITIKSGVARAALGEAYKRRKEELSEAAQ